MAVQYIELISVASIWIIFSVGQLKEQSSLSHHDMKVWRLHRTRILKITQYYNHRLAKHSQIIYALTWHDLYS